MSVIQPQETQFKIEPGTSKYTFHDVNLLNDKTKAFTLNLSVIGHIDMNAFFAQVEQVRLNLTKDDPVVCVQWQAVIAVNYAARKYGIKRMDTLEKCKEKCPHLVLAHAAVYEKGSTSWKYLDKLPQQGVCKVSLDPYRRESRKIFKILTSNCDFTEKASVDEGYLDLGRLVYDKATELFPQLLNGDPESSLPSIPSDLDLTFKGHVVRPDDETIVLRDWDDIFILLGSNIIYDIRREIYEKLEYTTSGGVSRNKNMAKLAGGFLKPDNQTVLLNSQIPYFMGKFELNEINGMGGKLGDQILSDFAVPSDANSIEYLSRLSPKELVLDKCPKLYEIVHGDNKECLRDRVEIKLMMLRKQMGSRPIKTIYDSIDWIKTFAGDLCNRLEDLDEESGVLTRPKTISVSVHIKSNSNSKQCPISVVKDLGKLKELIVTLSINLVIELVNGMFDLPRLNKTEKLNFKNIHPFNQIEIPPVHNLGVVISNLVKVDSAIDTFVKDGNVRNLFLEFEQQQKLEQQQKQKKGTKIDKDYINKLFQLYENENMAAKTTATKPKVIVEAPKKIVKQVKKPTKQVKPVKQSKPAKQAKQAPLKYNILDNIRTKLTKTQPTQLALSLALAPALAPPKLPPAPPPPASTPHTMAYCESCRDWFPDQEHKDYHFALELSKHE